MGSSWVAGLMGIVSLLAGCGGSSGSGSGGSPGGGAGGRSTGGASGSGWRRRSDGGRRWNHRVGWALRFGRWWRGRGRQGCLRRRALRRPARTYTFTRQDVRQLDAGSINTGLVLLKTDGTPTLIYIEGSLRESSILAAHLPETSDAGLSVSVAYQISRGELARSAPAARFTSPT